MKVASQHESESAAVDRGVLESQELLHAHTPLTLASILYIYIYIVICIFKYILYIYTIVSNIEELYAYSATTKNKL